MGPKPVSRRSTEAPMDWDYTSRSNIKPVWATPDGDPNTPRKRPHEVDTQPSLNTPHSPIFGANQNVPFIFDAPRHIPQTPQWQPPSNFSPVKPIFEPEVRDVDMSEASPTQPEDKKCRTVALGGMRRVFKSRQKAAREGRLTIHGRGQDMEYESGSESEDGDRGHPVPVTQNLSNHYTLNMPSPPQPKSDLPYLLLGYLQFFFNLSLILLFLYLVVQFILTVQRDVEHRISEYSMDIVQEIAMCASHYKLNKCASDPVPAMVQECGNWETCMNRDPTIVGRAKVGAELIAEVVNGFVEPISWKTLTFTLTSLAFLTAFINTLFSLFRSRHHPSPAAPPHQPSYTLPPSTPFPNYSYIPPAPSPSWGRSWIASNEEDLATPTRRRRLEGGASYKVK